MIRDDLKKAISEETELSLGDIKIEKPKNNQADYAFGVFAMAKEANKSPQDVASTLTQLLSQAPISGIERIEASGGYVNFFLTSDYLQHELLEISKQEHFGRNDSFRDKTVMVEYTDPNPFKIFHIGHLMSNTIGESIARLYTTSNAKVLRVNYQGDVGLHVAKALWGATHILKDNFPREESSLQRKIQYFGNSYSVGNGAYDLGDLSGQMSFPNGPSKGDMRKQIEDINQKIYDRSDEEINRIYDIGKKWSLEYFETIYKRLGTTFNHYFFESEVASDGLKIVKAHPDIFVEGDSGTRVFKGEEYGLHTRVFVNSKGLPTYEAKELALNKKKFDEYNPALSVIVTANEINEYFKVLKKAMFLTMPDVAEKTNHVGHGLMKLASGKMSSRAVHSSAIHPQGYIKIDAQGNLISNIIPADSFIDQTVEKLKEKESEEMDDETREAVAVGAIKYSILKQSIGKDIIFDFDTSLAVKGDSGPYLQYTYARLKAIIAKAGERADMKPDVAELIEPSELALIKHFLEFPVVIREAGEMLAPQRVALYVFELANLSNSFYEKVHILDDEDSGRVSARLLLVSIAALILHRGLSVLGIKTPERI